MFICKTFFSKTNTEYLICCQLINNMIKCHNLKRQESQYCYAFHTHHSTSADRYTHTHSAPYKVKYYLISCLINYILRCHDSSSLQQD